MQKVLALIAHDKRKKDLLEFCARHQSRLMRLSLIATANTGAQIAQASGLPVECVKSKRTGGDLQIAARVAGGEINGVILLCDPDQGPMHDPAVGPLLRVCDMNDVLIALNLATADLLIRALV
jgi:methylglyoxal synthase